MFKDEELEDVLKHSHTIQSQQAVWAEWNLNAAYNITKVGNYRFRPGTRNSAYSIVAPVYDPADADNNYTGATDSDIAVSAGFDDSNKAIKFISKKEKINLNYSLVDCFKPQRPRSGINKILYLGRNQYLDGLTSGISKSVDVSRRPRYYMASRYDEFKYWTSYRTQTDEKEITQEYGVSLNTGTGGQNPSYYIYDAAPFVIYDEDIPTNKIVVKMQTNVGEVDNGPFRIGNNTNVPDPLYGDANRTVPRTWSVQMLDSNNKWVEVKSFIDSDKRPDGSQIIGSDGTVELEYGLVTPSGYEDSFTFAGVLYDALMVPDAAPNGYAYLVKTNEYDRGVLYVSDGGSWTTYQPNYSWGLAEYNITKSSKVLKDFTNPDYYLEGDKRVYREFQFIRGLRVVVTTMNKASCTFDLIELSPRLVADITNKVVGFQLNKVLSDLGTSSMPTGNLLAATGGIDLFDDDMSFNENNNYDYATNTGSIISKYCDTQIKFMFFEIVRNIGNYDYYIPIKTMYSERIPQTSDSRALVKFEIRDLFLLLESKKAPEMLLTNVSLSYAVTVLLDNIGFSNYSFKRLDDENDLIIPFFFVAPSQNVAAVLQSLATSAQCAMFFDEYNNLVVMSKNYLLPQVEDRDTDLVLYGQEEVVDGKTVLPNIINLSSQEKRVYNGGEINYTTRYIQKSIGSIAQAPYIDEYKSYIYKPVLLWEVAGQEATKTVNDNATQASGYSLAAIPLKSDLLADLPEYTNGEIKNNVLDFGEGVYWLANYAGYFYANGEIVRYDAVEYSVTGVGNVWITNNQQYQEYFAKMRFNGKIYPTGRVRIYTKIDDGVLKEHGRGQFGTVVVRHPAGIANDSEWISDKFVRGVIQNAKSYLFNTNENILYPNNTGTDAAGTQKIVNGETYKAESYAIKSTRNGIIKNFLANTNITENEANYFKSVRSGSVQSSALVFNGPSLPSDIDPVDFVTYQYKQLDKPYKTFGTRMRIIGKMESGSNTDQLPIGLFSIYSADLSSTDPTKQVSISGGGGGLAFGLNPQTNIGYYYEIDALSQNSISSYKNNSNTVSYTIATSPVISVSANVVTVTLTAQHDFEVGDTIIVSGVVDDARNTSPTGINGQYTVTWISTDRKQFQYNITPITTTSTITAATSDGSKIVYTASGHNFVAGNIVTVTNMGIFNVTTAVITAVGTDTAGVKTFTVASTLAAQTVTNQSGTATYQNLTTTASKGGTVSRNVDEATLISNVFLYKTVSGYNMADIIKKSAVQEPVSSGAITAVSTNAPALSVTYTGTNNFVVGQYVNVTNLAPSQYNLTNAKVLSCSPTSFTLEAPSAVTGAVTDASGNASSVAQQMVVTLTTLREHSLSVNEPIKVTGISGTGFNGDFKILSVGEKSIRYVSPTVSTTAEADVSPTGVVSGKNMVAIPQIIWRGFAEILVDDGKFTGQSRLVAQEKSTVYDMSVEYIDVGTTRKFYLYLNDKQIATVTDLNPLPLYNNIALFVRGGSRCMFENVYALSDNFSENTARTLQLPVSQAFADDSLTESQALNRYAISGIVQNTYLSGISSQGSPTYDIYYEEFGTIMREAAYFNIKYDRAYPALYAALAKTLNRARGYTVSGFFAGSYGAEFLIFNAIDKTLNLDDTSGNYLRILGIAFTQNTTHSLKVDDFFKKNSNFVNTFYGGSGDSENYQKLYNDIVNSRNRFGSNDFSIQADYIQTDAAAESMMDWIVRRVMYPKLTVGVNSFATPHLQLGDIVQINFKDSNGIDIVGADTKRFVVYNIEYQKANGSYGSTVHLAEV